MECYYLMSNCSKYQNNYWYPKVAEYQHGEYCKGCGISFDSKNFKDRHCNPRIVELRLDKINNDNNHTIKDNIISDFQLLCISCNRIKNPSKQPKDLELTASEQTNRRAEKPLFEWLMSLLRAGNEVKYSYFVSEGSFKFDISPETIERRYFKKYLSADAVSSPFGLWSNNFDVTYIILKHMDNPNIKVAATTTI